MDPKDIQRLMEATETLLAGARHTLHQEDALLRQHGDELGELAAQVGPPQGSGARTAGTNSSLRAQVREHQAQARHAPAPGSWVSIDPLERFARQIRRRRRLV